MLHNALEMLAAAVAASMRVEPVTSTRAPCAASRLKVWPASVQESTVTRVPEPVAYTAAVPCTCAHIKATMCEQQSTAPGVFQCSRACCAAGRALLLTIAYDLEATHK